MNRETTFTRRTGLALGLCAVALPWLRPRPGRFNIASSVEIAAGLDDLRRARTHHPRQWRAIANLTVLDTSDGAVLIDAGPSHRYGTALKALAERLRVSRWCGSTSPTSTRTTCSARLRSSRHRQRRAGLARRPEARRHRSHQRHVPGGGRLDARHRRARAGRVAEAGVETIGERRFRILPLAGHTREDLCLFEESSGLLFPATSSSSTAPPPPPTPTPSAGAGH